MKRTLFIILAILLVFVGCRTLKEKDYEVQDENPIFLPALQGEIGLYNSKVRRAKADTIITEEVLVNHVLPEYLTEDDIDPLDISLASLKDIIYLYGKDVYQNICRADTGISGSIKLEFLTYSSETSKPLKAFTTIFLGIPALLGIPANSVTTSMKIKVSVLDKEQNTIRYYFARGVNTTYIAIYWGYSNDARPRSNIMAFKEAMYFIKEKMRDDDEFLSSKLVAN